LREEDEDDLDVLDFLEELDEDPHERESDLREEDE
jgi:hypothetical protein